MTPSIRTIQSVVALHYGMSLQALLSKNRTKEIAHARQVAMYFCYTMTVCSYPKIAVAFDRDHSTVIYAHDIIAGKRIQDKNFAFELDRLKDDIRSPIRMGKGRAG